MELIFHIYLKNTKQISMDLFCIKISSFSLPTQEELNKLWVNQKINRPIDYRISDNLLDYKTAI